MGSALREHLLASSPRTVTPLSPEAPALGRRGPQGHSPTELRLPGQPPLLSVAPITSARSYLPPRSQPVTVALASRPLFPAQSFCP